MGDDEWQKLPTDEKVVHKVRECYFRPDFPLPPLSDLSFYPNFEISMNYTFLEKPFLLQHSCLKIYNQVSEDSCKEMSKAQNLCKLCMVLFNIYLSSVFRLLSFSFIQWIICWSYGNSAKSKPWLPSGISVCIFISYLLPGFPFDSWKLGNGCFWHVNIYKCSWMGHIYYYINRE